MKMGTGYGYGYRVELAAKHILRPPPTTFILYHKNVVIVLSIE